MNVGEGGDEGMKGMKAFPTLVMICMVCYVVACACVRAEIQPKTVSEAETLEVYGNANEDDTIDMRDVTYIKLVIFGRKPSTEFCDANYDGRVSMLDVVQTKLIIVGKEAELTLKDSAGNIHTIDEPVERVVTMNTGALEVIRTLGAKDKVVGVSKYAIKDKTFFPEFHDYPNVGSAWSIDYEVILECEPEVLITYTKYPSPDELEDKLVGTGITVVRLDFSHLSSYEKELKTLAYILGKVERAEEFLDFYENVKGEIERRTASLSDEERPKVYLEADFGSGKKYYTCGEGHGLHEVLVTAGGLNIFEDALYGGDVDPEEVISRDPEIIVKYKYPAGGFDKDISDTAELEEIRDEILSREELKGVTAVKNGKVYVITWYSTRGAARGILALGYMAKWFHPEIFADIQPREIYQEYLTRFQGLDINLQENGVFAYPEP